VLALTIIEVFLSFSTLDSVGETHALVTVVVVVVAVAVSVVAVAVDKSDLLVFITI